MCRAPPEMRAYNDKRVCRQSEYGKADALPARMLLMLDGNKCRAVMCGSQVSVTGEGME